MRSHHIIPVRHLHLFLLKGLLLSMQCVVGLRSLLMHIQEGKKEENHTRTKKIRILPEKGTKL
jgi:hypothetical protein